MITIALLAFSSSVLVTAITPTLPAGTIITWLGLMAVPSMLYFGIKEFRNPSTPFLRSLRWALTADLLMAILWIPISYALAGNLAFNFGHAKTGQGSVEAGELFWMFTYSIPLLAISITIVYAGYRMYWWRFKKL
jgi:hypothetical protein